MTAELKNLLETTNAHPFLFVGSGFSHRYLGTDDWKGLVSQFASQSKPETAFAFEWYKNEVTAAGIAPEMLLPVITQHVEKDYARRMLSDDAFHDLRTKYEKEIRAGVSPLKLGVADFFDSQQAGFGTPKHPEEVSALGHARKNVAGIITTNFDCYLEHLFPDHEPYVGQDQLLFNQSYGVGEIYKIHGCVSDPASLVLTQSDYEAYTNRNAYLSAKLMTIFLEHPIIFIGYSITDSNIRLIFKDIANCLNPSQLATLSDRLIFIQRSKPGRPEGISTVRDSFGAKFLELKQVVLPDFTPLYKAIATLRSSYPPKVLRKLKKDVYELVQSTSPKERIRVIDIDDATDMNTVEFVMGVGISSQLAGQGYGGVEVIDLIEDLIHDGAKLEAKPVVEIVLPKLGRQISYNLPVFKYVTAAENAAVDSALADYVSEVQQKGVDKWISSSMKKARSGRPAPQSIEEISVDCKSASAKEIQQMLNDIAFVPSDRVELERLRMILVETYERFDPLRNRGEQTLTTNFRRVARIYDWLRFGHKKTPEAP
jgi:hypothetical protein